MEEPCGTHAPKYPTPPLRELSTLLRRNMETVTKSAQEAYK